MEGYLSVKEYARKHKISIFQTIKLIRENKVEYKSEIVDGKEKFFIKNDIKNETKKEQKPKELTLQDLAKEIEELKKRIEKLEQKL